MVWTICALNLYNYHYHWIASKAIPTINVPCYSHQEIPMTTIVDKYKSSISTSENFDRVRLRQNILNSIFWLTNNHLFPAKGKEQNPQAPYPLWRKSEAEFVSQNEFNTKGEKKNQKANADSLLISLSVKKSRQFFYKHSEWGAI